MSPNMLGFLNSHRGLFVSRKLLDLEFDNDAVDKINFLQPNGEDGILFSDDRKHPDKDNFDWKKQPVQNATSVGRIVKRILTERNIKVNDIDLEVFVNYWKAYFIDKDKIKIKIVSGEDIRYWYDEKNYHFGSKGSTLGNSCMSSEKCQSFFDIYVKNPEVCQMVIVTDLHDKLIARSLLWTTTKNKKFLDRTYYMNQGIEKLMIKWARQNIDNLITYESYLQSLGEVNIKVKLKEWKFEQYPFLDTLNKLNWKTGEIANSINWNEKKEPTIYLSTTSGDRSSDSYFQFSTELKDYLSTDDCYYDKELGSYMPKKTYWQKLKTNKKFPIPSIIKKYMNF